MPCRALVLSFCAVIALVQSQTSDSWLVNIAQGPVRGYREPDGIYAFYGIPYATVTERFKAPGSPPTWTETFEAVDQGIVCPQDEVVYVNLYNKTMKEDCLIVNIILPDINQQNLPVLISVHGGAFQYGYGNEEQYKTLARTKNIINVTFNYRLAVLGFLCLGTKSIPGNAGMKDKVALLRWVRDNIANFGGNPEDITINGCSAGSASVDLLALSNMSAGLISKVISDSGGGISPFAIQNDPIQNAVTYARLLNTTHENIDDLENFYKTAPVELFIGNSRVSFVPCIEQNLGEETFLSEAPYVTLRRGDHKKIPMIYGFTNFEGTMGLGAFHTTIAAMNEKFSDFLPNDLQFDNENQKEETAELVKDFYFGDEPISVANILSLIDYFTDTMFAYGTLRAVQLHVEAGNSTIFLHEYSFYDEQTPAILDTGVKGANHCTQMHAVQDRGDDDNITTEYRNMKDIMRDLWGNFIITGQPKSDHSSVPAWPPAGTNWSPHMSLGPTIELKGALLEHRARLWEGIYQQYYRIPEPPSPSSAPVLKSVYLVYISMLFYFLINK